MIIKRVVEKIMNLFLKEVVYHNVGKEHPLDQLEWSSRPCRLLGLSSYILYYKRATELALVELYLCIITSLLHR